jgi:hypothetical protein
MRFFLPARKFFLLVRKKLKSLRFEKTNFWGNFSPTV